LHELVEPIDHLVAGFDRRADRGGDLLDLGLQLIVALVRQLELVDAAIRLLDDDTWLARRLDPTAGRVAALGGKAKRDAGARRDEGPVRRREIVFPPGDGVCQRAILGSARRASRKQNATNEE
jgi:hypothetical protein